MLTNTPTWLDQTLTAELKLINPGAGAADLQAFIITILTIHVIETARRHMPYTWSSQA